MGLQTAGPIQIVPLHEPEAARVAAPPKAAKLTYRGGPLLSAVEVFNVFWGAAWTQQAQLKSDLDGFFDYVLTSPLMDQLAEYSVPGTPIGQGRRTGSIIVSPPDPAASVTDVDVQRMLQDQIAANAAFPKAGPNTLYFVYLPSGVSVSLGGSSSCQSFCGYHDAIGGKVFYSVMPAPDCSGCLGGVSAFEALTSTSSHELCEAVTDPVPGQGWYDDSNGEIGDICAWQTRKLGGFNVQLEWSNRAGACQ